MKYRKPEITTIASALEAVQSHNVKVIQSLLDGDNPYEASPNAYEADE
jgi:hypothetical protein